MVAAVAVETALRRATRLVCSRSVEQSANRVPVFPYVLRHVRFMSRLEKQGRGVLGRESR
jgi:hypothetical protein